ncbi:hypothetical protein PG995_012220, partial [Apiospora arundinis]
NTESPGSVRSHADRLHSAPIPPSTSVRDSLSLNLRATETNQTTSEDGTLYSSGDSLERHSSGPSLRLLTRRFTSTWASKRSDKNDAEGAGVIGPTWRKGNDVRQFWPQFWLPFETGMQNVNIHSFGYNSDWLSPKHSALDVHDFGRSLLEELRNSPSLRDNPDGPIILLGHSMGGIVIKKAGRISQEKSARDKLTNGHRHTYWRKMCPALAIGYDPSSFLAPHIGGLTMQPC